MLLTAMGISSNPGISWGYIGIATNTHRIHGAAIYGNMDPINIPQMLAYIPYMDPMGYDLGLSKNDLASRCESL